MSLATVQTLAAQSVQAVAQGQPLHDVLDALRQSQPQLTPAQRGALQDLAFGVQRFAGTLNAVLDLMTPRRIAQPALRSLLLVALYQLTHTQNAPHAIVHEAVHAASRIERGRYKALSNALLRRFQREHEKLLVQAQTDNPVAQYNLPRWWQKRLQHDHPSAWPHMAELFQSHPPLTLRINRRHTDAQGYLKTLQQHGLDGHILDSHAIALTQAVPITKLPLFGEGFVSVQDFGAQQAANWLAPQNGERILDACAAPGGKSGHLLECADIQLTALDIDPVRTQRIRDNLQRLQLTATIECADAKQWASCYDGEPFDAVLADIPCTASGIVRRHPDIKWLRRPDDAQRTAAQQIPLLDALWRIVKPNGRMLLATCSLFTEENQQQLHAFLQRHPNAHCSRHTTLLPHAHQDGFYYALIHKNPN